MRSRLKRCRLAGPQGALPWGPMLETIGQSGTIFRAKATREA